MARLGTFGDDQTPRGWFGDDASAAGWFDEDLTPAAAAPTIGAASASYAMVGFAVALKKTSLILAASGSFALSGGTGGTTTYGDTTVDTDATSLTAHTPTGPNPGSSWTNAHGGANDLKIYGNEVTDTAGGFAHNQKILELPGGYPSDDYDATAVFTFWSGGGDNNWRSIVVRGSSSNRIGYEFGWMGDLWYFKYNNGSTRADVQTSSYPMPASGTKRRGRVNVVGTTLRFYVGDEDGSNESLIFTVTGATELASGKAGYYWVGETAHAAADSGVTISNLTVTFAAGGGGFTNLKVGRKVAAGQGSLALTGQAATLTFFSGPPTIAAGLGTYTETGQSANLKVARALLLGQGTYTETGIAAGLAIGRRVSASQGSYTETGVAAGLRTDRKVAIGQGTFTETGIAARLAAQRRLLIGAGSYTETGRDASLLYGANIIFAGAAGSFSQTGQAAQFVTSRYVRLLHGTYSETGQAAILAFGHRLLGNVGIFTLTGPTVDLSIGGTSVFTGDVSVSPRFTGSALIAPRFSGEPATFSLFSGVVLIAPRFSGEVGIDTFFDGELEAGPG